MQEVVQDAMAGMSVFGDGGVAGKEGEGGDNLIGVEGKGGLHGVEGNGDTQSENGLLERSISTEQNEEEWMLRLAEAEDAMVSCCRPNILIECLIGLFYSVECVDLSRRTFLESTTRNSVLCVQPKQRVP